MVENLLFMGIVAIISTTLILGMGWKILDWFVGLITPHEENN